MKDITTDTRALLRLFRQSGYGDIHLKLGDYELFIAGPEGGANPLQAAIASPVAPVVVTSSDQAEVAAEQVITAPHIASFVSALAVGSAVAAGDAVARIELLGEPIDLIAERAGMVAEVLAVPGALIEYDAPLMRLVAA